MVVLDHHHYNHRRRRLRLPRLRTRHGFLPILRDGRMCHRRVPHLPAGEFIAVGGQSWCCGACDSRHLLLCALQAPSSYLCNQDEVTNTKNQAVDAPCHIPGVLLPNHDRGSLRPLACADHPGNASFLDPAACIPLSSGRTIRLPLPTTNALALQPAAQH